MRLAIFVLAVLAFLVCVLADDSTSSNSDETHDEAVPQSQPLPSMDESAPVIVRVARASTPSEAVKQQDRQREIVRRFNACRARCLERHKKSNRKRKSCIDDCAKTTGHARSFI
ncbi:hypothetical protein BV898_06695 [Hypsibius exemplaris]|uniref:Tim10-like domain-containing protein n=1 Tax=Hypsibius exemplaris TaxID=2072580 RepID=A0A1W0WVU8_HYPEX|nr:hypothetical protein BV898_06695 [Hypsibius exemplaris]